MIHLTLTKEHRAIRAATEALIAHKAEISTVANHVVELGAILGLPADDCHRLAAAVKAGKTIARAIDELVCRKSQA